MKTKAQTILVLAVAFGLAGGLGAIGGACAVRRSAFYTPASGEYAPGPAEMKDLKQTLSATVAAQ